MRPRSLMLLFAIVLAVILGAPAAPARAQGLLWLLPPDGTWVRYEGTYHHVETRGEETVTIDLLRQLTIKSVGEEEATYRGRPTPCRWIEIESVTGSPSEMGIVPGPVGARLYKVLVPEAAVRGRLVDQDGLPVSFVPVVKGYRRIGTGEVTELTTPVLQVFPILSLLAPYRTLHRASDDMQDPVVPLGPVSARKFTASARIESPSSRSVNEAELWLTADVPFGLAKWSVKLTREAKGPGEPRERFQRVSEITVEMSAHATGKDAQSGLAAPAAAN